MYTTLRLVAVTLTLALFAAAATAQPLVTLDTGTPVDFAVDAEGNTYVLATFGDTLDADPGPGEHLLAPETVQLGLSVDNLLLASYDAEGALRWAMRPGISGVAGEVFHVGAVAVASDGTLYVASTFSGEVDLDPESDGPEFTAELDDGFPDGYDGFIASYTTDGDFRWASRYESPNHVGGTTGGSLTIASLEVDSDGWLYAGGTFSGTADLDLGQGGTEATFSSTGDTDTFVASLDADGTHRWAIQVDLGESDDLGLFANYFSLDEAGTAGVLLTGTLATTADLDPGEGEVVLESEGTNKAAFFARYDADGELLFARRLAAAGGSSQVLPATAAVDDAGRVFLTGFFLSEVDFDPGEGTQTLSSLGAGFFAAYDAEGEFEYVREMPGGFGGAPTLAVTSAGTVYLYGRNYSAPFDFDPGAGEVTPSTETDAYLASYEADGTLRFAQPGPNVEQGSFLTTLPEATADGLYFAGEFFETLMLGTGTEITAESGWDMAIVRYDASGSTDVQERGGVLAGTSLSQPHPNPFGSEGTRLTLALNAPQDVRVALYDLLGRRVAMLHRGRMTAGEHALRFAPRDLPSGVYLVHVRGDRFSATRKVVHAR